MKRAKWWNSNLLKKSLIIEPVNWVLIVALDDDQLSKLWRGAFEIVSVYKWVQKLQIVWDGEKEKWCHVCISESIRKLITWYFNILSKAVVKAPEVSNPIQEGAWAGFKRNQKKVSFFLKTDYIWRTKDSLGLLILKTLCHSNKFTSTEQFDSNSKPTSKLLK